MNKALETRFPNESCPGKPQLHNLSFSDTFRSFFSANMPISMNTSSVRAVGHSSWQPKHMGYYNWVCWAMGLVQSESYPGPCPLHTTLGSYDQLSFSIWQTDRLGCFSPILNSHSVSSPPLIFILRLGTTRPREEGGGLLLFVHS